jgi:hypothetical protein
MKELHARVPRFDAPHLAVTASVDLGSLQMTLLWICAHMLSMSATSGTAEQRPTCLPRLEPLARQPEASEKLTNRVHRASFSTLRGVQQRFLWKTFPGATINRTHIQVNGEILL